MSGSTTRTAMRGRTLAASVVMAAVGALALGPDAALASAGRVAAGSAEVLPVQAGPMNYLVNTTHANRGQTLKGERAVQAAGGSVVASYAEIGVIVAQSDSAGFAAALRRDSSVLSVGATRTAAVLTSDPTYGASDPLRAGEHGEDGSGHERAARHQKPAPLEAATDPVADPQEAAQWDMAVIGADRAHGVTDGDRHVLVAVLDSGIEGDHPDLAANIDAAASASCLSGAPDTRYGSWQPTTSSHGTHVAGTIAAARNGTGIVGVAPNVRLASIKVVDDNGYIYPEAAICGFMQATSTGADITNNSYYIDPWKFWCDDDEDQRAVKVAVGRAVQYSEDHGVANVAAAGNSAVDLANKTEDWSSPNDTTPAFRQIGAGCQHLPAELDGVVTVSSTTRTGERSFFSNYGLGVIDVAAPGSGILSTVTGGGYGTKSGTSMAAPHVAGVLALLRSTHPDLSGAALVDLLRKQADDVPCPPGVAQCTGTPATNSYFGEGLVDALSAVR